MSTLVQEILEVCGQVENSRDPKDVLMTIMEEVGELSTEIAIVSGHKNRAPGKDGIVGEAVDLVIAAVDLLYLMYRQFGYTDQSIESLLIARARPKLQKWKDNEEGFIDART